MGQVKRLIIIIKKIVKWHIQREKFLKQEETREGLIIKPISQIAIDKTTNEAHLFHRAHWHDGKLYYKGKVLIDNEEPAEA